MTPTTLRYEVTRERYDEAVAPDGSSRPGWATIDRLIGTASPEVLVEQRRRADRLLDAEGAGHLVHDLAIERWSDRRGIPAVATAESRPWRLDPVPFVVDHDEFSRLANAVRQRVRMLEALLVDLYGPRNLVADGTVPASVLFGLAGFRPTGRHTTTGGRWLTHVAVDVVRDAAGEWRVVQDLTDAPAGYGYALLNRSVTARLMPDALRSAGAASLQAHAAALRSALNSAAPADRSSPRCVVLTSGPAHSTYVEHSYLAAQLGYHLAEPADLVMREQRLWLRALDGLEPVDVVYRRTEDAMLDPVEPNHDGRGAGVPGVVWGARSRGVALANAYGSAVAQHAELRPFLAAVNTRLLGENAVLGHLVDGAPLSTAPVFNPVTGAIEPHSVVLRFHAVAGPEGVSVMQGAVGRVLRATDAPHAPTAQLVKDVWVVGGTREQRIPVVRPVPPQVDFSSSVPKRAADALYWLGRSAERAEAATRCLRVVSSQLDQDPFLPQLADGGWGDGAAALLQAAQGVPLADGVLGNSRNERLRDELTATTAVIVEQLAVAVQEAMSVREFLSATTGRVLGRLARSRNDLSGYLSRGDGGHADDLELVLLDLAALSGLAMESTVRGPAWRFLDLGRRVERALVVLSTIEAALGRRSDPLTFQPLCEALLSSNESLVAYRRQYRSEVDLHAVVDILVRDDSNPRGLAFQLDRLREHVAALAWQQGVDLVEQASMGALVPLAQSAADRGTQSARHHEIDALVIATRGPLLQLVDAIARRWFADPVHPTLMRGR